MLLRVSAVALLAGGLLMAAGCATKKFVEEQIQTSERKGDVRLSRLENDLGGERGRVGRVEAQVTEVRSLVDEADTQAEGASASAEEASRTATRAHRKAEEALSRAEETERRLAATAAGRRLVAAVVVSFGFDKWELDESARTAVLNVVKGLKENPALIADLEGHTDSAGPDEYNLGLSQRRAEAVRQLLLEQGVALHRIQLIGFGEANPVADNKTKEGRAGNRRVIIKLFASAQ
ncbi:MAG: OmpA family protein [Candidatus Methylomirabilia bacterium]